MKSITKSLGNYYLYYDFLNKDELSKLNELLKTETLHNATLYNNDNSNNINAAYRRSKITWLPQNDKYKWLYDKILTYVHKANDIMWDFNIIGTSEKLQYGEYDSQYQGHYDWHLDMGSGKTNTRKISISIQLSDPLEYEGGDLQFYISRNPLTAPKQQGTMILFPSYFLHRVTPVTKGMRKSLVLWIAGEPLR